MNKIIKEQLKKCKVANIPHFDDSTTTLIINKYEEVIVKEGEYYIIQLQNAITNPTGNSVLASNWNGGSVPRHSCYKCEITKVLGKMIKINGLAYDLEKGTDLDEMWTGWLPLGGITLVKKL